MSDLAPLRVRLIVFAVLVLLALASIWLIDHRATQPADKKKGTENHAVQTSIDRQ